MHSAQGVACETGAAATLLTGVALSGLLLSAGWPPGIFKYTRNASSTNCPIGTSRFNAADRASPHTSSLTCTVVFMVSVLYITSVSKASAVIADSVVSAV